MNRRSILLLSVVLLVLLALMGFYLYLQGDGQTGTAEKKSDKATPGLIHVKSIYTAAGENLRRPTGIGATGDGGFYITLKDNARVIGFNGSGRPVAKWGESGIKKGQLLSPLGVAVNRTDNMVYVVDRARLRLVCYDLSGAFRWERPVLNPTGITMANGEIIITTFGPVVRMTTEGEPISETGSRGYSPGQFDYPRAATPLGDGDEIVVADTNNTRVQRVALTGEATAAVKWVVGDPPQFQDDPKTKFGVPSGVTVDDKGRTYVLDGFRYTITAMDSKTGKILHTFTDLEGDLPGNFSLPTGIVNLGGDRFAITDTYNDRVQIIRLLLPQEDNMVARFPWLWYLLPLLLLLALLPLLRRRVFVTREAMERAQQQGDLRLLAGAFKRLRVSSSVASDFADVSEEGVAIAPYLIEVRSSGTGETEEEQFVTSVSPAGWRRWLSGRKLLIASDIEQADRAKQLTSITIQDLDWVTEQFKID